jgi:hypothetical protein
MPEKPIPEEIQIQHSTKLFRRNSKFERFVTIKGDMIHVYLGYNIVVIQKLLCIASLIKRMSGRV